MGVQVKAHAASKFACRVHTSARPQSLMIPFAGRLPALQACQRQKLVLAEHGGQPAGCLHAAPCGALQHAGHLVLQSLDAACGDSHCMAQLSGLALQSLNMLPSCCAACKKLTTWSYGP